MNDRVRLWVTLGSVTLVGIYLTWQILQPFVDVILWAGVLSILTYPLYERFIRRGYAPTWASLATVTLATLGVLVPVAVVTIMLAAEAGKIGYQIKPFVEGLLAPDSRPVIWLQEQFDVDVREFVSAERLASALNAASSAILARTTGVIGGVVGFIMQLFFVLFTMFYFLRDAHRVVPSIREMLPLNDADADAIFVRTRDVIYASVVGVIVIAAIQGFLGGIAFWFLGIPSAVLWGVLMFLLSMVPAAGAFLVWAPAAVWLAVNGEYLRAGILVAFGAIVIGMIDNLLRPIVVGKRAKLSEIVIFFSVIGGLQVFGILGLVVGPVVMAITMSLFDIGRRILAQNQSHAIASSDTLESVN
jgi:predicted PurR-regulated permease PerM